MASRDHRALDEYSLIARVLHTAQNVNSRLELFGVQLPAPILPMRKGPEEPRSRLGLVPAERLATPEGQAAGETIPLIANDKMGSLVAAVKEYSGRGHPALALDLRPLAGVAPFGEEEWRPRTREELAELRAIADSPLILYGIVGGQDAEVAMEAGVEGIVVSSELGRFLGGPAAIEVLPEILDQVAGMTTVLVSGNARDGIDVFRYLAVGADAVIVDGDRTVSSFEEELRYAMRLTGSETLADIGYESIFAPLFDES